MLEDACTLLEEALLRVVELSLLGGILKFLGSPPSGTTETNSTAGDKKEKSEDKYEVKDELVAAPPSGLRADTGPHEGRVEDEHRAQSDGLGGAVDEHPCLVPLLGPAIHHRVVVGFTSGEPDGFAHSSSSRLALFRNLIQDS